jgi:hypothetical protein
VPFQTAGGELSDDIGQAAVVRVAPGFGPQDLHGDVSDRLPVVVEPRDRGSKKQ